jgi:hypothetical protein
MGIFDKLLMTDEEKEQTRQLNQISYINALNTHNQEFQQKVMALTAQNAQNQYPEELGLFLIKIGDRGYYVCEAVWKEIETLREELSAERERCAKIAEQARDDTCDGPVAWSMADSIAAAIKEAE